MKVCRMHEPTTMVIALTGDMGLWMSLGELGVIQSEDFMLSYFSLRFST